MTPPSLPASSCRCQTLRRIHPPAKPAIVRLARATGNDPTNPTSQASSAARRELARSVSESGLRPVERQCAWNPPVLGGVEVSSGSQRRTVPGADVHVPRYPLRDVNRAPWLGTLRALMIKVSWANVTFAGSSYVQPWPSVTEAKALAGALQGLVATNSYGRASISFFQFAGGALVYDLDLGDPSKVHPFDTGWLARDPQRVVLGISKVFERETGIDLNNFDRVVLFLREFDGLSSQPGATTHFVTMPRTFARGNLNQFPPADQTAAAVMHEMGHGFNFAHANAEVVSTGQRIEYGDVFDYMGNVTQYSTRFRSGCWTQRGTQGLLPFETQKCMPPMASSSSGTLVFAPFAAPGHMHANPVRKLQHGWLDDQSVVKVSGTGTYRIAPLESPSGVRALEIEAGWRQEEDPTSLFLYWRGNEPLVECGLSIAAGSRHLITSATRLLAYGVGVLGPNIDSSCFPKRGGNAEFPVWDTVVKVGGSYQQNITQGESVWNVTIRCNRVVGGQLEVGVQFARVLGAGGSQLAYPGSGHDAAPVLDVQAPLLVNRVLRNADVITVEVDAAVPNAARLPWHLIDHVEAGFFIHDGEGKRARATKRPLVGRVIPNPPYRDLDFLPTKSWVVRVDDMGDPGLRYLTGGSVDPLVVQQPLTRIVALEVTAYAKQVGFIRPVARGIRRFLMDQTR